MKSLRGFKGVFKGFLAFGILGVKTGGREREKIIEKGSCWLGELHFLRCFFLVK